MNNTYNLKSIFKFITHRNKIYSFFKNLNIEEFNLPFYDLIIILNNKQILINKFINFLKQSYEVNISVQEFNLIFLIYYHENDIIIKKTECSDNLINSVKNIINLINCFDPYDKLCILKSINRFKRYIYNLNKWKEIDKKDLVTDLSSEFYRLENIKLEIKKNQENELYINELEKIKLIEEQQLSIMNEIKKIDGMDIFNNLQPVNINYDNEAINQIKKVLEDKYWSCLVDDLKKIPINTEFIIKLLNEIKDIIYLILLKRVDMLVDLEKKINTNELEKEFDTHYFLDGLSYLLDLLRQLQSPEYDELTDKYIKNLKVCMIEGEELHNFVPKILKYILNGFYVVFIEKQQAIEKYLEWKNEKK